jgi:RNA polymerase sigma-70 factor, ECF subfamily
VERQLEEIYDELFPRVFRAALLVCGDRQAAEDSTQEAFARALERWDRLRSHDHLEGWLMTTAIRVAIRTSKSRRRMIAGLDAALPAVEAADLDATAIDLWRGVLALPPRQREAVVLYYYCDLAIVSVSRLLGCKEGTVKAHLSKARANLRPLVSVT